MKSLTTVALVLIATAAFAQSVPPTPPSAQDLDTQLQEVGCRAERQAAAQTIVQLQKQLAELQKQLGSKTEPPRSGATKK